MNALLKRIDSLYALFLRVCNSLQSPFLLAVRLYWGWQFLDAGWGKLTNMAQAVENFTKWNVPAPAITAHFVALLETTGGILLILGLASRLIAIPLIVNMLVAYITTERDHLLAIFTDHAEDFYQALPFTFLFAALLVLIFGPGLFSLDTLIKWYRNKNKDSSPVGAVAR